MRRSPGSLPECLDKCDVDVENNREKTGTDIKKDTTAEYKKDGNGDNSEKARDKATLKKVEAHEKPKLFRSGFLEDELSHACGLQSSHSRKALDDA